MATRTISNSGGTRNWDDTASWAEAAVPTSADDVVATGTSGALTINVAAAARSIDLTSYTNTLTHNAFTLTVGDASGGALNFTGAWTYTKSSGTLSQITMASTSNNGGTGWPFTGGGKTFSNVQFSGVGGKWVAQDTLNVNAAVNTTLTVSSGIFDSNNKALNVGIFNTNGSTTRTVTLGSSAITTAQNGIQWDAFGTTNLTITANTATVTMNGSNPGFRGGGANWNGLTLIMSGGGTNTITNGGTVATLTVTGNAVTGALLVFTANMTITGVFTVTGNSVSPNRILVTSDTVGTPRTLTVNTTVTATNADFRDITGAGTASWNLAAASGGSGDALGNSGITFTTPVTRFGVVAGNFSSTATWSTTSGGAGGASAPLPQDNIVLDANSAAGTYTANQLRIGKDITMTNFTRTLNAANANQTVYGSIAYGAGMNYGGWNRQIDFQGRGSHTITMNGLTVGGGWNFLAFGGTYTLQDNLTFSGFAGAEIQFISGTLNTNGKTVTIPAFLGNFQTVGSKTLTLGSSTINLYDTAAVGGQGFGMWDINTGATVSAASSTINISSASANSRSFFGNGKTYGKLQYVVAPSTGPLVITGANTFDTLTIGPGRTLTLPTAVTTTVTNWNVFGEATTVTFDGTSGNYFSMPDTVASSITGDIDLRAKVTPRDWTPTGNTRVISKRDFAGTNGSYALGYQATGVLSFVWFTAGVATTVLSTVAPTFTDLTTHWIRATLDVDNGSSQNVVTFYTSDDYSPLTGLGTWTVLGTPVTTAGVTSIDNTTAPVLVGSGTSGQEMIGKLHYAEIRNGINGTVAATFDPAPVTRTLFRTPTSFVSGTDTWTATGSTWDWDHSVYLDGNAATYISAPDTAGISITGDIDVRGKFNFPNWVFGATYDLLDKFFFPTNNRTFRWQLVATGAMRLDMSSNGISETGAQSPGGALFGNAVTGSVGFTWRASDGRLQFFKSSDWDPVANTGTWTQVGTDLTIAIGSLFDSTAPLEIGRNNSNSSMIGNVHYMEVRSGIGGTVVASYNPQAKGVGSPTYTDTQGNVWTHNGDAVTGDGSVRINSSSAGSTTTQLTKAGGGQVTSPYASVKDSKATPAATWYAYPSGFNAGNNSGWRFFNPAAPPIPESGLNLWLAGDGPVWQDSARTIPATLNSDPVGAWDDMSGLGSHAIQSTSGLRPLWKTSIVNGKPVLRWDGTDDTLLSPSNAGQKPVTYFAVINLSSVGVTSSMQGASIDNGFQYRVSSAKQSFVDQNHAVVGVSNTSLVATTWYIIAITYSAVGVYAFYLGTVGLDGTATLDRSAASPTTILGRHGTTAGAEEFTGDWAEYIKYDRVLTMSELNIVGNYLETKYATTWVDLTASRAVSVGAAVGLSAASTGAISFGSGDM